MENVAGVNRAPCAITTAEIVKLSAEADIVELTVSFQPHLFDLVRMKVQKLGRAAFTGA